MVKRRTADSLRRVTAAACAALACVVATDVAFAEPGSSPLRQLHTKFGVSTDDRYALFARRGADHIRIRDTKTGHSVNYATPCLPSGGSSFRRGYVLLNCTTKTQVSYKVLKATNLSATRVQNVPADVELVAVGRQWVAGGGGTKPDGSDQHSVYINWHTQEVRSEPGLSSPNPPRNLDDPRLRLRRPGGERGDVFPRWRGRYVLTHAFSGPHAGELRLHVGDKTTLLSRCPTQCTFVDILPGLVVWAERSVVRGYALPSGRRLRWPRRGSLFMPTVLGTAYELYINEFIDDPDVVDHPRWRTFVTRWREALR